MLVISLGTVEAGAPVAPAAAPNLGIERSRLPDRGSSPLRGPPLCEQTWPSRSQVRDEATTWCRCPRVQLQEGPGLPGRVCCGFQLQEPTAAPPDHLPGRGRGRPCQPSWATQPRLWRVPPSAAGAIARVERLPVNRFRRQPASQSRSIVVPSLVQEVETITRISRFSNFF